MTKPTDKTTAEAGADTATAATPAHVESAPGSNELTPPNDDPDAEDAHAEARARMEIMDQLAGDLVSLEMKARAQGHSLAQILAKAGQNIFGIDLL